jgi:hypothetical protein
MAFSLHAHHYRYAELLRMHPEQGLLTVYIVALAIVVIAILVAGISLIEETRSFLPRQ